MHQLWVPHGGHAWMPQNRRVSTDGTRGMWVGADMQAKAQCGSFSIIQHSWSVRRGTGAWGARCVQKQTASSCLTKSGCGRGCTRGSGVGGSASRGSCVSGSSACRHGGGGGVRRGWQGGSTGERSRGCDGGACGRRLGGRRLGCAGGLGGCNGGGLGARAAGRQQVRGGQEGEAIALCHSLHLLRGLVHSLLSLGGERCVPTNAVAVACKQGGGQRWAGLGGKVRGHNASQRRLWQARHQQVQARPCARQQRRWSVRACRACCTPSM